MGAQREQRVRVGWAQRPLLPRDQLDHDFGGSQLVETLSYDGTAHGIWAASPNHIVVVGVAGTIARYLE
jgi:hypothetical protein